MLEPPAARSNSRMNSGFLGRIDDLLRAAVFDNLLPNRGRDKGIARECIRLFFDGFGAGYVEVVEYQLPIAAQVANDVRKFVQQREPEIVQSVVPQGQSLASWAKRSTEPTAAPPSSGRRS